MFNPSKQNLRIAETNLPQVTKADDGKVLGVWDGKFCLGTDETAPPIEAGDNGKYLGVDSGKAKWMSAPSELPAVSGTDNGKLLGVSAGAWGKVDAPVFSTEPTLSAETGSALSAVISAAISAAMTDGEGAAFSTTVLTASELAAIGADLLAGKKVTFPFSLGGTDLYHLVITGYSVASNAVTGFSASALAWETSNDKDYAVNLDILAYGTAAMVHAKVTEATEYTPV